MIIGAPHDNGHIGAAVIYSRPSSVCPFQQTIIRPSDAKGNALFGYSVSISDNGNTVAIGGDSDNAGVGAVWIFTQSNGRWTEKAKLTASDANGKALQGYSVAISGDGNSVVFGGPGDNYNSSAGLAVGAAYLFVYKSGSWLELGKKMVSNNSNIGATPVQGASVAICDNGSVIVVGAPHAFDATSHTVATGGIILYSVSGLTIGESYDYFLPGSSSGAAAGISVAIDKAGDRVITGASGLNSGVGAALILGTISGGWGLKASILPPSGTKSINFGNSVAMTGDGDVVIIGDVAHSDTGAAWDMIAEMAACGPSWQNNDRTRRRGECPARICCESCTKWSDWVESHPMMINHTELFGCIR